MPRATPSKLTERLKRRQLDAHAELAQRIKAAQRAMAAKIEAAAERRAIALDLFTREQLYAELTDQYKALNAGIDRWMRELTEKTAVEWHEAALQDIAAGGGGSVALAFDRKRIRRYWEIIHPDNTSALAAVFTDRMEAGDKGQLRQAVVDTFRQQTLEGWTAKETHKQLQARWDALAKNLRSDRFVDAAGRPWTNASYLQMLTRTTLQNVSRESYADTLIETGNRYARISDDGDPCPSCRRWAGKVVDITGKKASKTYPTLKEARDDGWGHPNCECRLEYVHPSELKADEKKGLDKPQEPEHGPAWKASMTPEEADAWAKDSAIQIPLYHGTGTTERGATLSPEQLRDRIRDIEASGFKITAIAPKKGIGSGNSQGPGIYLTSDRAFAERYGTVLETRVNVKTPWRGSADDWRKQYAAIQREAKAAGVFKTMTPNERIAWWAKKNGYDAIEGRLWKQWVILDPKDITVVKRHR